jgi:hypothetical protein
VRQPAARWHPEAFDSNFIRTHLCSSMLKYLIPRIAWTDLGPMLVVSMIGGLIAGMYGVIHDQITYSISSEYFTNLKFQQFAYADFGLGNRVYAATIGFLATWWVGFLAAWFLARRFIPHQPRRVAYRQICYGFLCLVIAALLSGALAYVYGLWRGPDADYSAWRWAFTRFKIVDSWAFVRVAYIHNAGYFGGLIGLVGALFAIRPVRPEPNQGPSLCSPDNEEVESD